MNPQPWHITLQPIAVTYLWWYDTIAILSEYDDTHDGILPAGASIRIAERTERNLLICDLRHPKEIEKTQLPKGRIHRTFLLCYATPLQAILNADDFDKFTAIEQAFPHS